MRKTTKLRLIGGAILLFNLWLIGQYNLSGLPVLLLTFGFAIAYEFLVVRSARTPSDGAAEDDKHLYALVGSEIEKVNIDKGLWAKYFSEAEGNEPAAKARYMKTRVADIKTKQKESLRAQKPMPETHIRCPDCRLLVVKETRVCAACGCKLIPQ